MTNFKKSQITCLFKNDHVFDSLFASNLKSTVQVHQHLCESMTAWLSIASEYRAWTFFYVLPVLCGILEVNYFQHYMLFSEALWLLLQSTVPLEDIERAELLLQEFCLNFSALYSTYVAMHPRYLIPCSNRRSALYS